MLKVAAAFVDPTNDNIVCYGSQFPKSDPLIVSFELIEMQNWPQFILLVGLPGLWQMILDLKATLKPIYIFP